MQQLVHVNIFEPFCLEFLKFTQNQEECRKKWLATERELQQINVQLQQARKATAKLEV